MLDRPRDLLGSSPAILNALDDARLYAASSDPVLILGEPGTGKTTLAAHIHRLSGRRGDFTIFSFGGTSDELVLSDLFGHVRGGFTGAAHDRHGAVQSASDGTLLIDELGLASLSSQSRLLVLLDSLAVRKVGADRPIVTTARLVFATNEDLRLAVHEKRFRPDLWHRLGYQQITMPPLRTRREDIRQLFDVFYRAACERIGVPTRAHVSAEVCELFEAYHWPGNVRQLEQVARATASRARDHAVITLGHLPPTFMEEVGLPANQPGRASRFQMAMNALEAARGNQSEAARRMHLPRSSFRRLLERGGGGE